MRQVDVDKRTAAASSKQAYV